MQKLLRVSLLVALVVCMVFPCAAFASGNALILDKKSTPAPETLPSAHDDRSPISDEASGLTFLEMWSYLGQSDNDAVHVDLNEVSFHTVLSTATSNGDPTLTFFIDPSSGIVYKIEISELLFSMERDKEVERAFGYAVGRFASMPGFGVPGISATELLAQLDVVSGLEAALEMGSAHHTSFDESGVSFDFRIEKDKLGLFNVRHTQAISGYSLPVDRPADSTAAETIYAGVSSLLQSAGAHFLFDPEEVTPDVNFTKDRFFSKINFLDSSVSTDLSASAKTQVSDGGSIEVFFTPADAELRMSRLFDYGYLMPELVEQSFMYRNVVLRLSSRLSVNATADYLRSFLLAVDTFYSTQVE